MSELNDKLSRAGTIPVRALSLAERINTRMLDVNSRLAHAPLTLLIDDAACVVVFRYGAVVLFNCTPEQERRWLDGIDEALLGAYATPETEQAEIRFGAGNDEGVDENGIRLADASTERLQIVAHVLAASVALAQQEALVGEAFDQVEPLAARLHQRRGYGARSSELLRHLGSALLVQHKLVARVEVQEKPEILWESPELERLFLRMDTEYELGERHSALEHKLDLISRTAGTLLDLMQSRRGLRVEWYIVILIVIEIVLTLYELFFRHA